MNHSIYNWLLKPYPFIDSTSNKTILSVGLGFVVFIFLYVFQPFRISDVSNNILNYTLGFGLITTVVLLINLFIFPLLFPKFFNPNKWTIGKFLLLIAVIFMMISLSNWYYNLKVQRPQHILDTSLTYYIFVTVAVGIFPSLIYVYFIEKTSTKKHVFIADTIANNKTNYIPKAKIDKNVNILSENQKDKLTIPLSSIVYIISQGNYASIFCLLDGKIDEHLIRTSLSKIETQIKEQKHIIRCHKSYLVNTNHVVKINGNARGYLLKVNHIDFLIPVSRNFPKELLYTLVH